MSSTTHPYMERLGQNLSRLIEERGLARKELADRVGLGTAWSLSKIERGEVWPRPGTLERICEEFGTSVARLLGEAVDVTTVTLETEVAALRNVRQSLQSDLEQAQAEIGVLRRGLDKSRRLLTQVREKEHVLAQYAQTIRMVAQWLHIALRENNLETKLPDTLSRQLKISLNIFISTKPSPKACGAPEERAENKEESRS